MIKMNYLKICEFDYTVSVAARYFRCDQPAGQYWCKMLPAWRFYFSGMSLNYQSGGLVW